MNYKNPPRDRCGQRDITREHMKKWVNHPKPQQKKRKPTMKEIERQKEMDRITMEKRRLG